MSQGTAKSGHRTGEKSLARTVVKAAGTPDEGTLAAIRAYTLRDFAAEELVVREFVLAHNAIDRDREVFSEAILGDFARSLPGKGVHIRHPGGWDGDSGPGEGKVYAARVERMSHDAARALLREPDMTWPPDHPEAVLLMASAYYVRTPENEAFLLKLDAGIAGEVSIGFRGGDLERVKGSDGIELNVWRWKAPGTALEMSHVWLGAQPGARAVKNANRTPDEEPEMSDQELKTLREENAQLKAKADAEAKATTTLSALRKALGDDAALLDGDGYDGLLALVAAGKAHRKALIDDIVTAERHAGITGDGEEDIKAAQELYAGFPVEKLDAIAKRYNAGAAKGQQMPAGDPNAAAPGTGQHKAAEGTALANPLIAA